MLYYEEKNLVVAATKSYNFILLIHAYAEAFVIFFFSSTTFPLFTKER